MVLSSVPTNMRRPDLEKAQEYLGMDLDSADVVEEGAHGLRGDADAEAVGLVLDLVDVDERL